MGKRESKGKRERTERWTEARLAVGNSSRRLVWAQEGWPNRPSQVQGRERPKRERNFENKKAKVAAKRKKVAMTRSR